METHSVSEWLCTQANGHIDSIESPPFDLEHERIGGIYRRTKRWRPPTWTERSLYDWPALHCYRRYPLDPGSTVLERPPRDVEGTVNQPNRSMWNARYAALLTVK